MAYLYRHIRLDTNEPFYIGIGSDLNYNRAYSKSNRNQWWLNIIDSIEFRVDIILDELSWEDIKLKEIEFIKLYGRRDLGLGPLVNLTDGGEGLLNASKETLDKKSKSMIESHKLDPTIQKRKAEKIDWVEVSRKRSLSRDHKLAGLKKSQTHKNNPEIGRSMGKKISSNKQRGKNISTSLSKPILQYDLEMNFIKEWKSLKEASINLEITHGGICNALKNKTKTCGGFIWKYS